MNEKRPRVVDPAAVERARLKWCELCGVYAGERVVIQVHHVRTRGSGGDDVPDNLVSLCEGLGSNQCHRRFHNGQLPVEEIEAVVARRAEEWGWG